MIICKGLDNFYREVKEEGNLIIGFGAGLVANSIEDLFRKKGLWSHVDSFLDNDLKKEGRYIGSLEKKKIYSVDAFIDRKISGYIILITCASFYSIIEQLNSIRMFDSIHCYLYPELNYEFVKNSKTRITTLLKGENSIPKVIHYCWFGKGPKNVLTERCIESWKKCCPDYEIVEWNEDNYNISKNQYMREAYAERMWAYVADYARLDVLYDYGGIYLDTDVELLKSIDMLLEYSAFIAYGEWPCVNSGAGIGAVKKHLVIKEMRDEPRGKNSFYNSDGTYNMTQNCVYETNILKKYGFMPDFTAQSIRGMEILPPEVMVTGGVLGRDKYVTENTVALHHNGESWSEKNRKKEIRDTKKYMSLKEKMEYGRDGFC